MICERHCLERILIALAIVAGAWHAAAAGALRRAEGTVSLPNGAVTVEVAAGSHPRRDVMVAVELPPSLRSHKRFTLTRLDVGKPIPVQVEPAANPRVAWIIRDTLQAGKTRRYRLAPATDEPRAAGGVTVEDDGKHLLVKVGDRPVLRYNHAVVPAPDPKQPYYAKSGYIHPVYSPSGQVVTDDFNPDHAHQHGIMFAWRKTTFEGRHTNGWDQKARTGRVEHVKVEAFGGGPVFGFFAARMRQVDLTAPGGPKPVLDETWRVRIANFSSHFVFDIESTQTCAGDRPVTVEKCHYGGLMIRGHAAWHKRRDHDYLTSEGKTKRDGNHTRPRWVDMHGPLDGRMTGVTIADHPGNFRFPQPVRLHPTMPYFCFTPATLGSFAIEPGKPYVSRYRFYVHDGGLDPKAAERLWRDYADPPKVRIVAGR